GVDAESSCVYVMEYPQVPCGNYGVFTGRKMPLEAFLQEFSEATLEILDETYGYWMAKLDGFLDLSDRLLECSLELCYTGEFRYLLKDYASPNRAKDGGNHVLLSQRHRGPYRTLPGRY